MCPWTAVNYSRSTNNEK